MIKIGRFDEGGQEVSNSGIGRVENLDDFVRV